MVRYDFKSFIIDAFEMYAVDR